jgi:hypothetical protein
MTRREMRHKEQKQKQGHDLQVPQAPPWHCVLAYQKHRLILPSGSQRRLPFPSVRACACNAGGDTAQRLCGNEPPACSRDGTLPAVFAAPLPTAGRPKPPGQIEFGPTRTGGRTQQEAIAPEEEGIEREAAARTTQCYRNPHQAPQSAPAAAVAPTHGHSLSSTRKTAEGKILEYQRGVSLG